MKKKNKIFFYVFAVVSSICIICLIAAIAIQADEYPSNKTTSDYMVEFGGNPDVYARILAMADCVALQNEFDQAEANLQEPGTPQYRWGLGYMKASDDRMREIGCYESRQIPIEQIIAATFDASNAQTLAVSTPLPTQTLAVVPIEPTATIFIFELQTALVNTPLPMFETNTPLTLFTMVPTGAAGAVCSCAGDSLNCNDFSSHAAAQACFDYCVSQGAGDIHKLDQNNDGNACESL